MITFGSVCSGIGAPETAWLPLGWRCAFMSEIEAFPRAVLKHHHPETPIHGDFTTIEAGDYDPIGLLVGGTPCQSFSLAGLRAGLADDRGNLALEFVLLADRLGADRVVWENVPGVLSSRRDPDEYPDAVAGEDFAAILSAFVRWEVPIPAGGWSNAGIIGPAPVPGAYGVAWRVLDAQYFGVPQRRRRVFLVGYRGDWRRPAAVLFERESLLGHPPPSRGAGPPVAALTANGVGTCGADDNQAQAGHLLAFGRNNTAGPIDTAGALLSQPGSGYKGDFESETFLVESAFGISRDAVAFALRGRDEGSVPEVSGDVVSALRAASGGSTRDMIAVEAFKPSHYTREKDGAPSEVSLPLTADADKGDQGAVLHIGFSNAGYFGGMTETPVADTLRAKGGDTGHGGETLLATSVVRRLTPTECERLQGFDDGHTLITYRGKPAADGPRYMALGNSMAVPVLAWLGRRIELVESIAPFIPAPSTDARDLAPRPPGAARFKRIGWGA